MVSKSALFVDLMQAILEASVNTGNTRLLEEDLRMLTIARDNATSNTMKSVKQCTTGWLRGLPSLQSSERKLDQRAKDFEDVQAVDGRLWLIHKNNS